ncbi:MAG: DNA-3-methyladenine glycosylase I [Nitrospira sp.]|nr:DNA-3-methyladenine glycosylase I [Nitrospira sp.]
MPLENTPLTRCPWAGDKPHMIRYHDREWGRPVHSDRRLFEMLLLEGAQAGLTWDTILRRREGYRKAFDGFDPAKVAKFTAVRKKQLLGNPGIIRNRLKIDAAVTNAQAFLAVQKEFRSFDRYVWQFVGGKPKLNRRRTMADVPATSPESEELSKDLKKRGFRFVGSTIVYAFMQAVGMVDDHLNGCFAKTRTNMSASSVS